MGHAEHFLSRLERLDPGRTDLALGLYRDAELVRSLLERAGLPDGASRVAFALGEGATPAHLIVERSGEFVTCLGERMPVHDAEVIAHPRFLALRREVFALRDRIGEANRVAGQTNAVHRLASRLMTAGSGLTREEMAQSWAIAPLWSDTILDCFLDLTRQIDALGGELLAWKDPERWAKSLRGEQRLRRLWQMMWARSHLGLLAANRSFESRAAPAEQANTLVATFFLAMSHNFTPIAIRAAWTVVRIGEVALDRLEEALGGGGPESVFAVFVIAAIGCAHPGARERAIALLSRPLAELDRLSAEAVEIRSRVKGRLLEAILEPDRHERAFLERGQRELWEWAPDDGMPGWSSAEHVPEQLACAYASLWDQNMSDGEGVDLFCESLPWLGRARAQDLFMPEAEQARNVPFRVDTGLAMLEGLRFFAPRSAPIRAAATQGRNEPCACGSGKKFKKCCEGVAPAQGSAS